MSSVIRDADAGCGYFAQLFKVAFLCGFWEVSCLVWWSKRSCTIRNTTTSHYEKFHSVKRRPEHTMINLHEKLQHRSIDAYCHCLSETWLKSCSTKPKHPSLSAAIALSMWETIRFASRALEQRRKSLQPHDHSQPQDHLDGSKRSLTHYILLVIMIYSIHTA